MQELSWTWAWLLFAPLVVIVVRRIWSQVQPHGRGVSGDGGKRRVGERGDYFVCRSLLSYCPNSGPCTIIGPAVFASSTELLFTMLYCSLGRLISALDQCCKHAQYMCLVNSFQLYPSFFDSGYSSHWCLPPVVMFEFNCLVGYQHLVY